MTLRSVTSSISEAREGATAIFGSERPAPATTTMVPSKSLAFPAAGAPGSAEAAGRAASEEAIAADAAIAARLFRELL
jgi:hypothetical protein